MSDSSLAIVRRLLFAVVGLCLLVLVGSAGYYVLGDGHWTFSDCVFMTVITLSTVGFGELNRMADVPGARTLTIGLIVTGIGTLAYVQSNLTALLVEGVIGQALRRNRMRKAIEALSNHVVVAGAGSTGKHVIEELVHSKTPFVVIDRNREHLERTSIALAKGEMLYVHGDATEDHALIDAGVQRAQGVVAALTHDKDNLYVTLSARSLNAKARIVSKVTEDEAAPKMLRAGATSIVSPTQIGGRRMASDVVRPRVSEFLDQMRDEAGLRLDEVVISKESAFADHALRDAPIRKDTGALIVAVRDHEGKFVNNPEPDYVLLAGCTLVALADDEGIKKLRKLMG